MIHIEKNDLGEIHFRMPNVVESLRFYKEAKINPAKLADSAYFEEAQFSIMADAIEKMDKFMVMVDLKVGDVEIKSLSEAINHIECMGILIAVAGKLLSSSSGVSQEKKPQ